MEIRHLTTFIKTVQYGSISKAAEALGYSQSAATIQIKQLEKELGTQLFDRIGRRLVITDAGKKFFPYANRLLDDFQEASLALTPQELLAGHLRVGTVESLYTKYLSRILVDLHTQHPQVSTQILTDTPRVLFNCLNTDRIDLVYLLDKSISEDAWVKVFEQEEEVIFVTQPHHPLNGKKGLHAEDLLPYPFILTERNASYRRAWDHYLSERHLQNRPFLEISSTKYITHLLEKMDAISLLPRFTLESELAQGTLIRLDVIDFHPEIYRQLFYHKDKWVTREMQEFIRIAQSSSTM